MKRRLLAITILIFAISVLLFFLSRDANKTSGQKIPEREINLKYQQVKLIEKTNGFRIDVSDSALFVLVGDVSLKYTLANTKKHTVIPRKGIYSIFLNGDTLQYFETQGSNLIKEVKGQVVETLPLKNVARNVLLSKGKIYVGDYSGYKLENDFIIRSLGDSFTFNVSKAISGFLNGIPSACKSFYTEGRIISLDLDTLAFLPYTLNLIIKISKHNGGSVLSRTIDSRDRIELLANTISIPGMSNATACQPSSGDEYMHTSATGNERFIIIGSYPTVQKKDTLYNYIDFYNKRNLSYAYSVALSSTRINRDYILDMKLYGNDLYVLTSKSVYKYFLPR